MNPRIRETPARTVIILGFGMAFGVALLGAVVVRKQIDALQAALPKFR